MVAPQHLSRFTMYRKQSRRMAKGFAYTIAALVVLLFAGIELTRVGTVRAQVVPVLRDSKMRYAVQCTYNTLFHRLAVLIGPVETEAGRLRTDTCPPTREEALVHQVKRS